jgi:hypothetical protein
MIKKNLLDCRSVTGQAAQGLFILAAGFWEKQGHGL